MEIELICEKTMVFLNTAVNLDLEVKNMKKYKVISIINMKGGVGKTTLTTNLAYTLASKFGKRILLVDIDPQSNATQTFMKAEDYVKHLQDEKKLTVLDIFSPRLTSAPSTVKSGSQSKRNPKLKLENIKINIYKNGGILDIIPSTLQLFEIDTSKRGTENKLKQFLDKIKDTYDYILIDCPPTISIFTLSAYIASEGYIVALKPDHLSSIGLPLLERTMNQYKEDFGSDIDQIGIVFTMVDIRTRLMNEVMEQIRKSRKHVFEPFMRQSIRIAEASRNNRVIQTYNRADAYQSEVDEICKEFLKKTGD